MKFLYNNRYVDCNITQLIEICKFEKQIYPVSKYIFFMMKNITLYRNGIILLKFHPKNEEERDIIEEIIISNFI